MESERANDVSIVFSVDLDDKEAKKELDRLSKKICDLKFTNKRTKFREHLAIVLDALVLALLLIITFRALAYETSIPEPTPPELTIRPPVEETAVPTAAEPLPEVSRLAAVVPEPTETPEVTPEPAPDPIEPADPAVWGTAAERMAQTLYGEDPHGTKERQAGVYWVVLNRVDSLDWFAGQNTPEAVCAAPGQFAGFDYANPVVPEHYELALDVLGRWLAEKDGREDVGRVLPREYRWFTGDGHINYFRDADAGGHVWDWRLASPYEG